MAKNNLSEVIYQPQNFRILGNLSRAEVRRGRRTMRIARQYRAAVRSSEPVTSSVREICSSVLTAEAPASEFDFRVRMVRRKSEPVICLGNDAVRACAGTARVVGCK